jgi:DNA-binding beta-propeller fold protein YncE
MAFGWAVPVLAVPYQGYTYDRWENPIPGPAAYLPTRTIGARDVCETLDRWIEPTDIRVDRYNNMYLLDTGNNRIVIFDHHLNLIDTYFWNYDPGYVEVEFEVEYEYQIGVEEMEVEIEVEIETEVEDEDGDIEIVVTTEIHTEIQEVPIYETRTRTETEIRPREGAQRVRGIITGYYRESDCVFHGDAAPVVEVVEEDDENDGDDSENGEPAFIMPPATALRGRPHCEPGCNGVHWYTFNNPNGIFINDDLDIFIADTGNRRVVVLDSEGNFLRAIENVVLDGLDDAFDFQPMQVLEDRGGRVYVIVRNVFEGILGFTRYGDFLGYFGTIPVRFNPIDMLWRNFMTQEQRSRQRLFVPTEFASMDIDSYGFIFATNIALWHGNAVMRLNPRGEDVLLNHTELRISGDQRFRPSGRLAGPSVFVDIVARPYGMYTALDSTRGRIYTYDSEGHLLYVFSGTGNIKGMSRRPVAIELLGDSILVLDQQRAQIVYFEATEYGALINEASRLRYIGDEVGAVEKWRQLIVLDENFTLAYAGIGRSLLAAGENQLAMDYLRRAMDVRHYSIAFRRHRTDVLQASLDYILTGGLVLVLVIASLKVYRRVRGGKKGEEAE